jgi:hypothetical protein
MPKGLANTRENVGRIEKRPWKSDGNDKAMSDRMRDWLCKTPACGRVEWKTYRAFIGRSAAKRQVSAA